MPEILLRICRLPDTDEIEIWAAADARLSQLDIRFLYDTCRKCVLDPTKTVEELGLAFGTLLLVS